MLFYELYFANIMQSYFSNHVECQQSLNGAAAFVHQIYKSMFIMPLSIIRYTEMWKYGGQLTPCVKFTVGINSSKSSNKNSFMPK